VNTLVYGDVWRSEVSRPLLNRYIVSLELRDGGWELGNGGGVVEEAYEVDA